MKKGQTPEGTAKRLRVHRHNGYLGHVVMMKKHMIALCTSDSTTLEAKNTAEEIYKLTIELEKQLKTRVD